MELVTLIKKTRKVKMMNAIHPGFDECSRCGGNWGWKKYICHKTGKSGGLFLFCIDCDKIVTIEERWKALDWWKAECIRQSLVYNRRSSLRKIIEGIKEIEATEFIEFPRKEAI